MSGYVRNHAEQSTARRIDKPPHRPTSFPSARWLTVCLLAACSPSVFANCTLQGDGVTVICDANAPNPYTSSINAITVGSGTLVIPANGANVIVQSGASIATTGAAVQVSNNSTVTNAGSISTTFINAYGIWSGDPNNASSTTAGFGNTLENDGTIRTNGSNSVGLFARTANRTTGNTLINRGRIDTYGSISGASTRASSAGIRSESVVASSIFNYGIVAAHGAYATIGTGNTMGIAGNGVEMAGPGTFTNEAGGSVSSDNAYGFYGNGPNANGITVINAGTLSGSRGAVLFGAGQSNNTVMLEAGSTTTGSIDAGAGGSNNTLVFDGFASSSFANAIPNWQLVALRNGANVTLSSSSYALTNLSLDAGTTATFATPALTIAGQIVDNGSLIFASPNTLNIAAPIQGSGAVTQAGPGTLVLSGAGSYTGTTTVAGGTLQAGGANVFSPVSAFTVNGGATLDLGNTDQTIGSLAGAGAVNLGSGTLTTGGLGTSTRFDGVMAGSGGLVKAGTGTMTLTGDNTYTGGTTITAGMLSIGNGGTSGSIVGDVTDDGRLIFDRADASTFAGVISGSGSVKQLGGGTTILTGNNTYTGGTVIANGALQLGDGGTSGAIVGDVQNGGTLIFNRSDTVIFSGIISDWTTTTPDPIGSVQQNGTGTTILTSFSTYTGTTQVNAGTLAIGNQPISAAGILGGGNVTVAQGATLGGYGWVGPFTIGPSTMSVTNNGTIAVADAVPVFAGGAKGDFAIAGTLINNNLIQLAGSGTGNNLLLQGLVGQGASRMAMNAVLDGDDSPSDILFVGGGAVSGHTTLNIANVGGQGAATPGNGIPVVVAYGPETMAAGVFSLGNVLEAGPYRYALFRGSRDGSQPDNWYLRSEDPNPPEAVLEALGMTGTPSSPGAPSAQPYVPYYRPETSLYTALPSMTLNYGKALMGTLHERVGEEEQLRDAGDTFGPSSVWARVIGQDGEWDAKSGGIFRDGPSFDDNMIAVQAGTDLYRSESDGGARDFAGLLASVGHGHGGVTHYDDTSAGNDRFDAYSFGGYWTRFGASSWYVDGVLQGTWYDAKSTSNDGYGLSTHGFGAALSVESGYPFQLADDWSLEPQGQLIYQSLHLANASDAASRVQFRDGDSLAARIGGRASRDWQWGQLNQPHLLSGWLFANIWHEFKADTVTAFSSDDGNVPFHSDLSGSWWELGAGMSARLSKAASLYASLSYDKGFNEGVKAINGNLGMRLNW
jgi:outer membrane autotransporter protein